MTDYSYWQSFDEKIAEKDIEENEREVTTKNILRWQSLKFKEMCSRYLTTVKSITEAIRSKVSEVRN